MKKEHPILFSTPMVQALLDGRKTQTRRTRGLEIVNSNPGNWRNVTPDVYPGAREEEGDNYSYCDFATVDACATYMNCAKFWYGQIGDILWVRESFKSRLGIDIKTLKSWKKVYGIEWCEARQQYISKQTENQAI